MSATETIALSSVAPKVPDHVHPFDRPGNPPSSSPSSSSTGLSIPSTPPNDEQNTALAQSTKPKLSTPRLILTIFVPSLIRFWASFTNGIITVGLPVIARSISLERALYLWPQSVYGLTAGAILLIAGSVADIVGARSVELLGIFLLGAMTLACGLAQTGVQLVVFRAIQGVALAMHLPASVSIITAAVPAGRARNLGFACLGMSQPLGFSVGLVLSGIMIEKAGWRSGFYLSGGATLVAAMAAYWALPKVDTAVAAGSRSTKERLRKDVDWVGGVIASGGLAILAYVLAILSADLSTIRSAETASLLAVSLALLLAFPAWVHFQTRAGRPALIPNSLWENVPFSSTCIIVALSYGVINSSEIFASLYFQEVQNASTLTTSLYLLPNLVTGVFINLTVGLVVHRVPARWLVSGSAVICACSPLIMALVDPAWDYWYLEFWAQVFAPFSGDVLFTVGLIIVSDSFPEKTQALAGAVFNTVAQFGMSLGVGVCQVVALGVMDGSGGAGHAGGEGAFEEDAGQVLKGYRASFWAMFAYMLVCVVVGVVGLRNAGKVGLKRE
ncbi:MFS general substrate transporter [Karstenula rhodostoma CBS 690.94]|uniref:MFS general substrate transporter n=1 Tax=Karstenula rhodostoma CBS 690.94 TaxID=1392251 RepID=A0A9P4U771_9PLEO|nr:MFS general substrate transporter [Karstenula rhodostoma CBS 690.94]